MMFKKSITVLKKSKPYLNSTKLGKMIQNQSYLNSTPLDMTIQLTKETDTIYLYHLN